MSSHLRSAGIAFTGAGICFFVLGLTGSVGVGSTAAYLFLGLAMAGMGLSMFALHQSKN